MNKQKLQKIVENHKLWLESFGKKGACADLSHADLSNKSLAGWNLSGADLSYTNLSGSSLLGTNLAQATLTGANLHRANLIGAYLVGAVLPSPVHQFFIGKHGAAATHEFLQIGCEIHSWGHWLKHYKSIAKNHRYSTNELKQHHIMIKAVYRCMMAEKTKYL